MNGGGGMANGGDGRCSRSQNAGSAAGTAGSAAASAGSVGPANAGSDFAGKKCGLADGGAGYELVAADDEDEMAATERELAEDAQWKRIQQNTFTRWANEHLKTVGKNIGNLETDLSDGLRLVALIEVLAGRLLPKHNKRPTFRSQKLENVSVALKFLDDQGIKLVNIDSTDIVDCKLKLILGLIWTLILHYSISMPIWEGDNDIDQNHSDKGPTPKQRLLNWIQSKIPDLPITNFTTDWNDGKAVGALVDAVAPGLCPDWQDWKSQNALQNAKEAMVLADDWLDVKQLIKPEELVSPNMDELSMMTYLSQYPNAKLKQGAPLRPRTNANRVRAYGPGIEPTGPKVKAPAKFTVETFSAGHGDVDVKVENPRGQLEPADVRFNNDRSKTYSVSYTPRMEGIHKVGVKFAGKEIPKSPFVVQVEGTAGDATKVTASGPGLQPDGVMVNKNTHFDIVAKDAGSGTPEVIIVNTAGQQNALPMKLYSTGPGTWRCEYVPQAVGPLNVNIFFENQVIPFSPFGVRVQPVSDAKKVRVSGRGVQPNGVRVGDVGTFHINAEKAGEGKPEVQIIGPGGVNEPAVIKQTDQGLYDVTYHPKKQGRHVIMVTFAGQEVPRSPFEVNVGPYKETNIQVYGPGLTGGVVGYPAVFSVESNGETGALGFSIEGPSQAKIECDDNGDGSADIKYYPTAPGEYAVHILCDQEDIPKSPYIAQILPSTDYYPDRVECSGKGIGKNNLPVNVPVDFTIDTRKAGQAPLDVKVLDSNCIPVPVTTKDNRNGTFTSQYTPKMGKKHSVQVNYGGVAVPGSPFKVLVTQPLRPEKVQIFGPGVEAEVKPNRPTHFTVDCRDAGPGNIDLKLRSEKGVEVPLEVTDNEDGTYLVDYTVPAGGDYSLQCRYGDVQIPQSPLKIRVPSNVDVSKIKVDGLETMAPINSLQQFHVITEGAGKADFTVVIRSPSGNMIKAHIVPTHDGYLINFTPTELGEYWLNISFGGQPVLPLPHKITCTCGSEPSRVTAFGPGLERGVVRHPAEFVIDTKRAGRGGLGVTVEGPCEAAINCRDNGDGTCSVAYLPMEAGDYVVNITFNDEPIPGSPFQAVVVPDVNWKKIRAIGSGIQPHGVLLNTRAEFLVDTKELGIRDDGRKVTCTITNPSGNKTENVITPLNDGAYKISYTPFEEGQHTIEILYDGLPIPGSPFVVNVKRGTDSTKCRAFGPGLERGIVNQSNQFTVETRGAGSGGLGLAIEGPSEAKMTCKDNRDGSCSIEYVPTEPGDYDLSIKFADQHIPGSPFKVEVDSLVDVKKVRVYGSGIDHCRAQITSSFKIDASGVGKAPLDVSLTTDRGPLETKPEVYDNGDGTYDVVYVASTEGSVLTAKVLYNGEHIPNSPFKLKVRPKTEPDRVKIVGPVTTSKGGVLASMPTEFTVDASQAGTGNVDVQVLGPDSQPRKVRVVDNMDGTFKVNFTPDDCGLYTVPVKFGGQNVPSSPLHIQAYATGSANDCYIPLIHNEVLRSNEEHKFVVDARRAGHGKVTCRIKSVTGKDADVKVIDNEDGTFTIYYKLQEPGDYTLNVKFGGQPVPNGLCAFTIKDEEDFVKCSKSYADEAICNNSEREFQTVTLNNIPLPSTGGHVTAEVKMPSGKSDKPVIEDNRDGTVSLKYEPREEGLHELLVKYNGEHVQGSPFKFHVDSISSGYVTAYGSGLTHGVSGEPAHFTISTKGAGAGGLSLAVEGPSKAEISCHDNKDGTVSVSYLPTAPGEYKITVKFGDKHIKGSPYNAKVTGEGRKRNQISVGSCSEVSFPGKVTDADTRLLNASIQAPSGLEEPCFLKKLPSGNLGISFTPREIGEHVVSVKRLGKHIANSPFKITVAEREVGDAKKVKVCGSALKDGKTHVENVFTVDTRNAGYGGLSLSIEGPSKAEIQCKDKEDGTLNISYKPTEPGYYIVNLKFADHHVDGSPFTVKVTGEGSNRQREKIERQREAVPITEVGSQCKLSFKMPGITTLDLTASVSSPVGVVEDAEVHEVEDGLYAVHFVPKELGVHTVSVKYKDIHIPGSPFQFTVGPLRDGGAHRVHAGGPGLERGEQGQPCEFNVWTREAGAGALAISVEGPSKAEIDFKDRRDGSCYVSYVVTEPGEYRVGIKFNDQHIPDSPYKLFISPAMGDAHKLEVAQFPVGGVQADKPAQFLVHKNGAKGNLDGKVVSPSGAEDDCFIQSIDAESYSVRFMPRENGIHNIHIKFNGVHIPGSPFRIKVGKEDADPAAVHAHGNGLGEVKTGQKTDFLVDTCNAGAGTLAVTIDGPSKVSMDCTEVEEGYKVRYTPLVPGDYYISLKYNGYHIAGSPFKVKCKGENLAEIGAQETSSVVVETVQKVSKAKATGPQLPQFKSNASKVTCKGVGLKKAYLQKQNQFTVAAGDAGNNILFVGLYGPKGPCDEVFIKHTGRNNYNVNYLVKERGEYLIMVKWGEDHIPGSPFRVEV